MRVDGEAIIDPQHLSKAEGETYFCPHWAKGAIDSFMREWRTTSPQ